MDTRISKINRRSWLAALLAPIALFLAGCELKLVDLTPETLKANPSQTYTITARVKVKNTAVVEESIKPEVIIDGQAVPMTQATGGGSIWEYDYRIPEGRNTAAYYILVRYQIRNSNGAVSKEDYTDIRQITIERRYSVELEVDRAPVGTRVAVLGRGFTRDDQVLVGGVPAEANFESATSLAFFVPALPPGRSYEVVVIGASGGQLEAGSIRVDGSQIRVSPGSLELSEGQRLPLAFSIPTGAPPGGLTVSVTTDVPNSVIMPEVFIPANERSTSITIEGGAPGTGSLFVEASGYSEVVVPIRVD